MQRKGSLSTDWKSALGDPQEGVGEPPAPTQGPGGPVPGTCPSMVRACVAGASLLQEDPIPCPPAWRNIGGDLAGGERENKNSFQTRQDGRKCLCYAGRGSGKRQKPGDWAPGAPGQTLTGSHARACGPDRTPAACLPRSWPASLLIGIPPASQQRAAVTKLSTKRDLLFLLIEG